MRSAILPPRYLFGHSTFHSIVTQADEVDVFAHAADINLGRWLSDSVMLYLDCARQWVERSRDPANAALIQQVCRGARANNPRVNICVGVKPQFPPVAIALRPDMRRPVRTRFSVSP